MARRKKTEEQMKLFEEGGLKDEGGTVDPVSGNDVPVGSTQKEVRDDIPAQLSEGEFVFPADVTRYIGLENLMELRNKAKRGLAQMEAMGQMGNSEEATMDDTAEMDVDIDALIDEFDPNSPETMQFAMGGVVKAQAGALIPSGQMPPQQFSYGYMPPTPPQQAFQYPQYSQMVQQPAQGAVSGAPAVEDKQYIGPNGELITIRFMNGKPQQNIPQGFKVYKPEEVKTEVVAPTVAPENNEDRSDDREREEAEAGRIAQEKELNNLLAKYDPAFAKVIAEDPFMTGKLANPYTALMTTFNTVGARTDTIPGVLEKFGIPVADFEVPGIGGKIPGNKYDVGKLANTLRTADLLAEQFGIDEDKIGDIISYTNLDTDGDGRVTKDDLVDKSGNLTKAGQDLFMDIDGEDVSKSDPASSRSTPSSTPTDYESEAAGVGSSRGTDAANVDSGRGGMGPSQSGPSDSGGDRNDPSDPGGGFGPSFSKGGAVQQTERALKSSRKKK